MVSATVAAVSPLTLSTSLLDYAYISTFYFANDFFSSYSYTLKPHGCYHSLILIMGLRHNYMKICLSVSLLVNNITVIQFNQYIRG